MNKKLKKDIVIPKGTIFKKAPEEVTRLGDDHYETIIGLTKNTSGSFVYCIGDDKEILDDYFENIEI